MADLTATAENPPREILKTGLIVTVAQKKTPNPRNSLGQFVSIVAAGKYSNAILGAK
jgi:hypothetical protein